MTIALAGIVSLLAVLVPAQDNPQLLWKGKAVPLAELSGTLSPESRADATVWAEWARTHAYTVALDDSARVLVLQPNGRRPGPRSREAEGSKWLRFDGNPARTALGKKLKLVDKLLKRADTLYPMPPAEILPPPDPGTWTEGDTGVGYPNNLPILVEVRDVQDLGALLDRIQEDHEYIRDWAVGARQLSGFLLTKPLLGAWVVEGEGLEEWSPKHDLVNRATRLLVAQRYGRAPEWFSLGLGWQAELELFNTVYSFPGREGFIFVTEHSDWDKTLRSLFRKRKDPLPMTEIVVSRSGRFQSDEATRSWGVAEFLVKRHPDAIAPILTDLAKDMQENGRRNAADGTWSIVTDYEAPAAVQAEVLRRHAGEDVLEELLKFMARGAK